VAPLTTEQGPGITFNKLLQQILSHFETLSITHYKIHELREIYTSCVRVNCQNLTCWETVVDGTNQYSMGEANSLCQTS